MILNPKEIALLQQLSKGILDSLAYVFYQADNFLRFFIDIIYIYLDLFLRVEIFETDYNQSIEHSDNICIE